MLRYLFVLIWFIILTFIVIPISYTMKICVTILSLLWNHKDNKIIKEIYWNGLVVDHSVGKEIRKPWKDIYVFWKTMNKQ